MNYFEQKKTYIILWWIGLFVVFSILVLGYFFIALYLAIPLMIYRYLLPLRRTNHSKMVHTAIYLAVCGLLIFLSFTGIFDTLLRSLRSQNYLWVLGIALLPVYYLIVRKDYRYFSNLTASEVANYYRD